MQINPGGLGPNQRVSKGNAGTTANPPHFSVSGENGANENTKIVDLVGRLSIVRLVELLNNDADIRAEMVEQARSKLASGEYLLPQAAGSVADSVLGLPLTGQHQS